MPSTLIYCDTNVYLDYFYDRRDNIRPLGEFAARIFQRTFSCEFKVVISNWLLEEIRKQGSTNQMNELIMELRQKDKLIEINGDYADREKAKNLPTHFHDAIHIILAIKSGAKLIVTNNLNDFRPCEDMIPCVLPHEL